ncbi:hypothetical protein Pd630_LPD05873 [Rhodococcus opacus PD630]|nr:hypothetical protein Pd630_LPD05873 [Rhodococcus opacus PD630]
MRARTNFATHLRGPETEAPPRAIHPVGRSRRSDRAGIHHTFRELS